MTDELELDHNAPWPRWLRFKQACTYVGRQTRHDVLEAGGGQRP